MDTTVLLVDDHAMFRSGLRLLLEKESDLKVVGEAGDGQTSLDLVGELAPDVVVMDISMPDLSGIEATRQILAAHPGTKILTLSIHGEKRFVDDMLAAGATGYLLKESAPEELIDGIRAVRRGEVYLSAGITGVVVSGYREFLSGDPMFADQRRETVSMPLLTTKLYSTPITPDLVPRAHLLERLDRNRLRPLTMISAPAGYGKSVLASMWLGANDYPSAWVSLDETDNDLRTFLSYMLAALEQIFPRLELKNKSLLEASNLPPAAALARYVLNALDQIEDRFILVLDDLHRIKEQAIYDLLGELLQHPPRSMHLVLVSRQDPPLPITTLRARGQVTEIRIQDLCFSASETGLLLGSLLEREIQESTAAAWTRRTEGWVTALRLVALSLRQRGRTDSLMGGIQGDFQYLQEYLLAEVLSHLPPTRQDGLLKLAILDRFCAPLCEALWQSASNDPVTTLDGSDFLRWLQYTNLFLIPLDGRGEWFRLHHLFQQHLHNWLEQQTTPEEIAALHDHASVWFAENNLIDEALKHALAAGDISNAVRLVEKHRNQLMNTEQWSRLESWLQKLPHETIEKNPKLLITQAWTEIMFYSQYNKWVNAPDQIADLLSGVSIESDEKTMISAEIDALRTTLLYAKGEVDRAIESAERVLRTLHPESNSMRGQTALILAMALQGKGNLDRALKTIRNTMDNTSFSNHVIHTKMLTGLCVVHWLEGDIPGMKQPALQLLRLGEESHLPESISFGRYFLGCFHYIRNELTESESHFTAVVETRYLAREHYHAQCAFGLALCKIAQDRNDQARQVVESVIEYTSETDNIWLWEVARAFQVELALRLSGSIESYNWTKVADPNFLAPMYVFYVPKLTAVRAMLTSNTPESQKEAADLLDHLQNIVVSTHNTRVRIDVLALQALLHDLQGEQAAALEKLAESLAFSELGGFIRNFVDLGAPMANLLIKLYQQGDAQPYISQILAAFPEEDRAAAAAESVSIGLGELPPGHELADSLTKRELQTLKLMATDLSAEEIAAEMFVATATVRTHTKNIYSKLNVHSRLQAVQRAKDLGLL